MGFIGVSVCQSVVLGSSTTALGITTSIPEAAAMEKINTKLNKLNQEYSPQKKIELLLKTCKIIYDSMSVSCPGQNQSVSGDADQYLASLVVPCCRTFPGHQQTSQGPVCVQGGPTALMTSCL